MGYVWSLFSFKGRSNRARYLAVQLTLLTLWFVLWIGLPSHLSPQWQILDLPVTAVMIWVNLATTARRLHDRNRSGWWTVAVFAVNRLSYLYYGLFLGLPFGVDISIAKELLLVMIAVALTILQTWIVIELFFLPGTDGPNRFGPDPTRATPQSLVGSRPEPAGVPDFLLSRASNSRH
jgi:uncharacterized membrane protein YhaH (DUF805 family)